MVILLLIDGFLREYELKKQGKKQAEEILKEIEDIQKKIKIVRILLSYDDYFKEYAIDSRFDKKEVIFYQKNVTSSFYLRITEKKLVDILFKKVCLYNR